MEIITNAELEKKLIETIEKTIFFIEQKKKEIKIKIQTYKNKINIIKIYIDFTFRAKKEKLYIQLELENFLNENIDFKIYIIDGFITYSSIENFKEQLKTFKNYSATLKL